MKANVVTKITIAAEPATVFKYLTDLSYHYLWNPQITSISKKGALKLHSTYQTTSQVLGVTINSSNEVTKYKQFKELQLENNTGTVHYIANFKLIPQRHKTVLVCSTVVSSKSKTFAFAGPVLKQLARRELQTDMQALK